MANKDTPQPSQQQAKPTIGAGHPAQPQNVPFSGVKPATTSTSVTGDQPIIATFTNGNK